MTFSALAAWQAWLLIAAAALVAGALFLIKLRAPRTPIASLLLWRRVLDESRQQTLWERIRRAVSLAVTVLIALALALAAARPMPRARDATAASIGRVLIVVDSSWSMLARTRSGETRWERAVAQARRLASEAAGAEVALATPADGLVQGPTTDGALIDAALDRLAPGSSDPAAWPRLAGSTTVHFITDGSVTRPRDERVIVHSVFEPAANVAITAFDTRPSVTVDAGATAYLEVANYAASPQQVRIVLTRGSTNLIDRRLEMQSGETLRQAVPIANGGDPTLSARVEAGENALEIDDEAFASIERAHPLSVAIVGADTAWLRALFERDPGVRATLVTPERYPRGTEGADVLVFDRWSPRDLPARPAVYFAPAAARVEGSEEQRPQWHDAGAHPAVRGVDPFTMTIARARAYAFPDAVPVARSARGTPLLYVHDSRDRRFVIVTFGPNESNLPSAPGFPVLMGNTLDWLTTAAPSGAYRAGLIAFNDTVHAVTGPRGLRVPLTRLNGAALVLLRAPGLYEVQGGGARSAIAVNVGDPQVSNLARTYLNGTAGAATVASGGSNPRWWIYCAIAAFLLAFTEWWTWQRRITV
jgi:hypothetical protein